MISKIITGLLYLVLAILLYCIGLISYLIIKLFGNAIILNLANGVLSVIFILIYLLAIILPAIFCKKLKIWLMPLIMIISSVSAVFINKGIYHIGKIYISSYTREKWDKYENLRYNMIDDLESKYNFIGMSEEEIIDILGEPMTVSDHIDPEYYRYEYYIDDGFMDPWTYDIIFRNGVAVESCKTQH